MRSSGKVERMDREPPTCPARQFLLAWLIANAGLVGYCGQPNQEPGLVGYWKLKGDCRDYSGLANHGVNHGVNLAEGAFDGISAYIDVPASASLKFGTGD